MVLLWTCAVDAEDNVEAVSVVACEVVECGACVSASFESNSIGHIVVDPPYNCMSSYVREVVSACTSEEMCESLTAPIAGSFAVVVENTHNRVVARRVGESPGSMVKKHSFNHGEPHECCRPVLVFADFTRTEPVG